MSKEKTQAYNAASELSNGLQETCFDEYFNLSDAQRS